MKDNNWERFGGYVVDGLFKTDEEAENYPVNQSYVNNIP